MHQPLLQVLPPEHVAVAIGHSEARARRRGLTSALDAMGSDVRSQANPRWLWRAIAHRTGQVVA
jgi:hypothetical protein